MNIPKFIAVDKKTNKVFPVGIIDYTINSVYIEQPNKLYTERDFNDVILLHLSEELHK